MKKTLISVFGVIILILIVVACVTGIKIGKFSIYSIKELKAASLNLDLKVLEANEEVNQNYVKSLNTLETSVKSLTDAKEKYEAKIGVDSNIGITQIEKYKIEYIWDKLGSYASDEGLKIVLDFEETNIKGTYDIKFSVVGSYVGITDFLYDIENDDELNYKVEQFEVKPTKTESKDTSGKTTNTIDTTKLQATFVVKSIIINFS